jgi:hypothetical protein
MNSRPLSLTRLAALLLAAGCATAQHASHPPTAATPLSSNQASQPAAAAVPAGQQAAALHAARAFALSYARYLAGTAAASQLASSTATVRGQLGPRIPTRERHGPLAVLTITQQSATSSSYVITVADHAHTFLAAATVRLQHRRWLVVSLTPPDLDTILNPNPSPRRPSAAAAAPLASARGFLAGYVRLIYGHAQLSAVHDPTRALHTRLRQQSPRATATLHALHPRVATLGIQQQRSTWTAKALIADSQSTYELILPLVQQHGQWLVSDTEYPK